MTFPNINLHNSVAGELFLETKDEQLRLFIKGLGQFTQFSKHTSWEGGYLSKVNSVVIDFWWLFQMGGDNP